LAPAGHHANLSRMGMITQILLVSLPLAFAHQVVYFPVNYYVPVAPLVHIPQALSYLQNVALSPFGNRRHEAVPVASYHGNCQDLTADWQEWESGVSTDIRIKRPAPSARAAKDWEVELVWDRPVKDLQVYNAVLESTSGSTYRIKPAEWQSYSAAAETDEVRFNLKAEFEAEGARPGLKGVAVDGVYHTCKPGPQQQQQQADVSTKGVRLAPSVAWPSKILGLYILLADDDEDGYDSTAEWEPELFEWQQKGSNVLFFTFIHPGTMDVPPSFKKLAASRGTGKPGAVPADTVIMFAIGGYAYSLKPNPWDWLTSKEKAEAMAEKVAKWPAEYGCDGIDLDLEEGAGAKKAAGPNMIHFIRRLKELNPSIIVSQPTYGYPQVQAETDVINASWDEKGVHQGLADSIGLMVYEGTQALNYVKNFANGSGQWQGFPIKVNAPKNTILLGAKGSSSSSTIMKLARASVKDDLLGIMVWYASVKNGFDYAPFWDASTKQDSINGYLEAMQYFDKAMASSKTSNEEPGFVEA